MIAALYVEKDGVYYGAARSVSEDLLNPGMGHTRRSSNSAMGVASSNGSPDRIAPSLLGRGATRRGAPHSDQVRIHLDHLGRAAAAATARRLQQLSLLA